MQAVAGKRLVLATVGAATGLSLYLVTEGAARGLIGNRAALVAGVGLATFFAALLVLSTALPLLRAAGRAAPLGVLLAGLATLLMFRWDDASGMLNSAGHSLALLAVAVLPLPFLLTEATTGTWRNYPGLFRHSWTILLRGGAAVLFTLAVWLLLWLSDALLQVVGLRLIGWLVDVAPMPWLISGLAFGLAVAVVAELSAQLPPQASLGLVLRLLRLLIPVVAAVSAVFVMSAAVWGIDRDFRLFSPAPTLLAMAAAGITLITATLDEDGAQVTRNPVLLRAAQLMALLLPALAVLAGWALWVRVAAQGLTPDRLFAAVLVVLALLYGLVYAVAVVRGRGWAGRIRRANPLLALMVMAAAVLWLTPVLDAERLSATDQADRFLEGRKAPDLLNAGDFGRLGRAGAAALARLTAEAESRGDTELLAALAEGAGSPLNEARTDSLRAEVEAMLPVQPASATGTRSALLFLMQSWELEEIRNACESRDAGGAPGCVLVVADLLPALPGEEAVLALDRGGWISVEGLYPEGGYVLRRPMQSGDGRMLSEEAMRDLIARWQAAPPPVAPALLNQIGTGTSGLFFVP